MKPSLKVLTAGNFENEQEVKKKFLEQQIQCDLNSVTSGEEAINRYHAIAPDVILIDVILKGMTGLETARWIKEQNSAINVILISEGMGNFFSVQHGLPHFCDGHILKSSPAAMYVNIILKLLRGRRWFFNS